MAQYQWPVETARAICKAESTNDPNATGYNKNLAGQIVSVDRGLMQINSVHADMVDGDLSKLYDPSINVAVAYRIYTGRIAEGKPGFSAWSTYNNGKYREYL